MINRQLSFDLPKPWSNQKFEIQSFGEICFLVGPNGSGKSRFAQSLKDNLGNTRLLGTDRIQFGHTGLASLYGDGLAEGLQKNHFQHFKSNASEAGSAIDTFVILEERPDLRLMLEATLSSLFAREIRLEWDSGKLIPRARMRKSADSYRLDREECHGIRELLVLLTHLYNNQHDYLIIDEPELNLHPQFQAFLMQEIRKIASAPTRGTWSKGVFLITHSPFIVDLRSFDDLASVIAFNSDHDQPRMIKDTSEESRKKFSPMLSRLNVHHKQLFFADSPVFVEGILDAQIVEAIQIRRKVSIVAAGSCIIDVGGKDEVTKYVELCEQFQKKSFFLFDLDSLFFGNLKRCIREDGSIIEFLAKQGVSADLPIYCGQLDKCLGDAINLIDRDATEKLHELKAYIQSTNPKNGPKELAKARVAVLVELAHHRDQVVEVLSKVLADEIEGKLNVVLKALQIRNILVLPGGALENYLPSYTGNRFEIVDSTKASAINIELEMLASGSLDDKLEDRYGALFKAIARLPTREPVDFNAVLENYAADFIHKLQGLMLSNPSWTVDHINRHFASTSDGLGKLFTCSTLSREEGRKFSARIDVSGFGGRYVEISNNTNAGMREFKIRQATLDVTMQGK